MFRCASWPTPRNGAAMFVRPASAPVTRHGDVGSEKNVVPRLGPTIWDPGLSPKIRF